MNGRQALRRTGRTGAVLLVALCGTTLLAGCGSGPTEPVAPTPAPSTEYPFFVQVRSATLGYLCGGALIDPSWVLTAARCVTDGLSVIIGGGTLDDEAGGEVRAVAEARLHPSWTSATVGFDAALLHLATPSTFTPVRLADDIAPGAAVRAIGHALVEGASNSGQLRQVDLRAAPETELVREYGAVFDPAAMIGAGIAAGQQPFCGGDRGSPLLVGTGIGTHGGTTGGAGGSSGAGSGDSNGNSGNSGTGDSGDTGSAGAGAGGAGGYRLVGVTSRERGCPPLARPGLFANVVSGPVRGWIETHVPRQVSGFVLADRPTEASYRPEVSGGGTHTVTRGGVGTYTVSFAGLGHGVVDGLAQVTVYGPTEAVCQVTGAVPVGSAQEVRVRCAGPRNEPVDAAFSASYARPVDAAPYAAALVSGADLQTDYNSGGGDNTVRRNGTGDHTVTLPTVVSDRGAIMITPYGDRPATCAVTRQGGDQQVRVRCFAPFSSSTPVDTAFALSYTDGPAPAPLDGGRWAWVLARPDAPAGGLNSAGGDNTVTRIATGTYQVRLGRMGPRRGIVHVTTADQRSQRCAPGDLTADSGDVTVTVRCAADTAFTLLFQS